MATSPGEPLASRARRWTAALLPGPVARRAAAAVWNALALRVETRSGLGCRLSNRSDWLAFQEIFVRREYDSAVGAALGDAGGAGGLRVLDLGANIGLFALYLIDSALAAGVAPSALTVRCVEGSPSTYRRLRDHVEEWRSLTPGLEAIHALAGRRRGAGRISDGWSHLGNAVQEGRRGGVEVSYVDLEALADGASEIDLLKCDIEGSEEELVAEYPSLLARTRVLAIELHGEPERRARVRSRLVEAGFEPLQAPRRAGGGASLETFTRAGAAKRRGGGEVRWPAG